MNRRSFLSFLGFAPAIAPTALSAAPRIARLRSVLVDRKFGMTCGALPPELILPLKRSDGGVDIVLTVDQITNGFCPKRSSLAPFGD